MQKKTINDPLRFCVIATDIVFNLSEEKFLISIGIVCDLSQIQCLHIKRKTSDLQ